MTTDVLSLRAINRATLERQLLLRRQEREVLDAVEHLVGMQAQAPFPPYYGLWSRLDGFRPGDLAERLLDRSVVRIALMRGTVHLVTARDCLALRELVQPIFDRDLRTNTTYAPQLAASGVELDDVADAARKLVEERPRPPKEIGVELGERWPDVPRAALAHAARGLLPLVQVPPRAVWGASGQPTLTTAQAWLGDHDRASLSVERLVVRYLAAFGPASVRDVQVWSGLTRLGEIVEGMELRTFRDEQGRELLDLPDAPRPDPDVPAPVRFVAEFDNLVLSHADRTRVLSEDDRKRLFLGKNGVFPGTILVDGFVHGTWRIARTKDAADLVVTPYRRLTKKHQTALAREGARLLDFAAPDVDHDVRFAAVAD